jgi:hypothetical protein
MAREEIRIDERGRRDSCLGSVLQLKVWSPGYPPLLWSEVWDAFVTAYPGRWAVQLFPPAGDLVDGKAVYHLFVCDSEPEGLNLRKG